MTDKLLDDLKAALGDAYLIERELTGGGMSRVFVAREHALGREVVIKVLPPELAAGINRERFRREIQLAARISHPYIVPLLQAGESGELLWFTMPFIPGDSLKARLEREGPLPVREVLQLLRDVVEALAYAHSRGVVHRDIKPANILSDGSHALVTDFGVAKALGASLPLTGVAGHTTSGMAIGTPAYMAPEQLAADPSADHRVDIYAVGLLAYELLTGASPFSSASPTATMAAQLTRTPEPLAALRPEVPAAFSGLVERCLAKSPDDRPQTAQEVLVELDKVSGALAAESHRSANPAEAAVPRASSLPLALGALAVVALVAAGVWWTGAGRTPVPPAVPETVGIPVGGSDTLTGTALANPDKPLTRADSLAIAAALRDELERIDPDAAKRPAVAAAPSDSSVVLARQLAITDSLVRVKLAEFSARAEAAQRLAESAVSRGASGFNRPPSPDPGRRTVLVVPSQQRNREPAFVAISESLSAEVTRRLERSPSWEVIDRPDAPFKEGDIPAEVFVTIGTMPAGKDSAVVRIAVRNTAPGSSFGYNVVTSNPFPVGAGPDAYSGAVREAFGVLETLRRVDRGQVWGLDQGRIRVFDSLRKLRPPNGPTDRP